MSNKNDSISHTYTKGSGIAFGSSIKIDAPPCYSDGLEVGNRDLTWVLRRQSDLEEKLENIERSLESLRDQLFGGPKDESKPGTCEVNRGLIDNMLAITARSIGKTVSIESLISQIADGFGDAHKSE
ncbi:hypothetical protein WFC_00008 [Escherichia phage vB_EcoM_WFC]|uniref:Uncharacterized protein n=1 Tax=Escherichia phage vB_EcoM_WFC TaxID=2508193 RepID=A0A482MW97_9CAUD|nr:hypothetical protein HOV52_gp008 [Escherichia phage vB_EcoM_WFC]QBQ77400.1 hypothetical protein WFC_00008 [Escherichia phage vB_EcoM_WFC]